MIKDKQPSAAEFESHIWVKDIQEDDLIQGLYLAKAKRLGTTKKGEPFLSITLADRTGDIAARVWDRAEAFSSLFSEGDILEVEGRASSYRNQVQVTLSGLKTSENSADPTIFLETTPEDINDMLASLKKIIKEIKDPYLKNLLDRFLSDRQFVTLFKKAPAAKNFHHNYVGGLLEHTLSVCRLTGYMTGHYPQLDRDLLIAGAFLHDIGKIREFKVDTRIEYSDEGRLLGHLVLGIEMLEERLEKIRPFPKETALRLKHLILSHHGQYDFGSPKRPKFLEAFALHMADDLDAKINGLGRFMEKDRQEGAWTDFNRLFERYLLKGSISEAEEEPDPGPAMDDRQRTLFST